MLVVDDVSLGFGGERGFAGTAQTEQQRRTTGYIFAVLRFGAVLENVVLEDDRAVDYADTSIAGNTRGAYPPT